MKIIFLDVDGVLNCRTDFKKSSLCLDKVKVKRLHKIVKTTKASIVLSSTWRKFYDHCDYLVEHGVKFMDKTPTNIRETWSGNYVRRGEEINKWLKSHHVDKYVIIDDNSDMLEYQLPFFVQTSFETGLLDEHVKAAIHILCK